MGEAFPPPDTNDLPNGGIALAPNPDDALDREAAAAAAAILGGDSPESEVQSRFTSEEIPLHSTVGVSLSGDTIQPTDDEFVGRLKAAGVLGHVEATLQYDGMQYAVISLPNIHGRALKPELPYRHSGVIQDRPTPPNINKGDRLYSPFSSRANTTQTQQNFILNENAPYMLALLDQDGAPLAIPLRANQEQLLEYEKGSGQERIGVTVSRGEDGQNAVYITNVASRGAATVTHPSANESRLYTPDDLRESAVEDDVVEQDPPEPEESESSSVGADPEVLINGFSDSGWVDSDPSLMPEPLEPFVPAELAPDPGLPAPVAEPVSGEDPILMPHPELPSGRSEAALATGELDEQEIARQVEEIVAQITDSAVHGKFAQGTIFQTGKRMPSRIDAGLWKDYYTYPRESSLADGRLEQRLIVPISIFMNRDGAGEKIDRGYHWMTTAEVGEDQTVVDYFFDDVRGVDAVGRRVGKVHVLTLMPKTAAENFMALVEKYPDAAELYYQRVANGLDRETFEGSDNPGVGRPKTKQLRILPPWDISNRPIDPTRTQAVQRQEYNSWTGNGRLIKRLKYNATHGVLDAREWLDYTRR
jgi:hypothetical protein